MSFHQQNNSTPLHAQLCPLDTLEVQHFFLTGVQSKPESYADPRMFGFRLGLFEDQLS